MALIEGGRAMRTRRTLRLWLLTAVLVAWTLAAAPTARAATGEYYVANCKSDLLNFSTSALTPHLGSSALKPKVWPTANSTSRTAEIR